MSLTKKKKSVIVMNTPVVSFFFFFFLIFILFYFIFKGTLAGLSSSWDKDLDLNPSYFILLHMLCVCTCCWGKKPRSALYLSVNIK